MPKKKDTEPQESPNAEGEITIQPATEIPNALTWPIKQKINKYGFLHFDKAVLQAMGLPYHTEVSVELNLIEGGMITVKASTGTN